jgi:hypothetical protein
LYVFQLQSDNVLDKKRKKALVKKDPIKSKIPERPAMPSNATNNSFFFTKYVMEGRHKNTAGDIDPREALLKMDEVAKKDPIFFGRAYAETQPTTTLQEKSFEEEQEEHKKKLKRLL